jgi:hypothetical protein
MFRFKLHNLYSRHEPFYLKHVFGIGNAEMTGQKPRKLNRIGLWSDAKLCPEAVFLLLYFFRGRVAETGGSPLQR